MRSISSSTPNIGDVVSAATGNTVFAISADTGAVTRKSGAGARMSTGSTRATVTIACGRQNSCNTTAARIRIGSTGTPSGRARTLTNFTVASGSAHILGWTSGSNPIEFVIGPVGRNNAKTFYVGADFPIAGSDSGGGTGSASSGFYVFVAPYPQTPTRGRTSGRALAKVLRPLSVTKQGDLAFGTVIRPASGIGAVALDPATGQRTFINGAAGVARPSPTLARFKVTGEGGRAICVEVPLTVVMTDAANHSLTAVLVPSASGAQTLSSSMGHAGSFSFTVGGGFALASATPAGAYSGSLIVTLNYN